MNVRAHDEGTARRLKARNEWLVGQWTDHRLVGWLIGWLACWLDKRVVGWLARNWPRRQDIYVLKHAYQITVSNCQNLSSLAEMLPMAAKPSNMVCDKL